jgi:hypothetical protein
MSKKEDTNKRIKDEIVMVLGLLRKIKTSKNTGECMLIEEHIKKISELNDRRNKEVSNG